MEYDHSADGRSKPILQGLEFPPPQNRNDGDKKVVLTLIERPSAYKVGPRSTFTVTIVDN